MKNKIITESIKGCADLIFNNLKNLLSKKNKINIALSGGKTPIPVFDILSNYNLDWERIIFFLVDERDYKQLNNSNYHNLKVSFFDKIKSESNEFFIKNKGLNASVLDYDKLIKKKVKLKNNIPCFDFIFLGMGDDGHVASIFPNTPAQNNFTDIICKNFVAKLDSYRLTFTFPLILNADKLFLLISGKNKLDKIKNLKPKDPINYILKKSKNIKVINIK
tara:strand:- start:4821 stop:5480 length:660 start_codon:yes stop_codon:yes gene_type:complete